MYEAATYSVAVVGMAQIMIAVPARPDPGAVWAMQYIVCMPQPGDGKEEP